MRKITLNPTLFTENETPSENAIKSYFIQLCDKFGNFIPKGNYQFEGMELELTHSILKRARMSNGKQLRYEVLEDKQFDSGSYAEVYFSLGVLVPEKALAFKVKPIGKERVCKKIPFKNIQTGNSSTLSEISKEGSYTLMNKKLHAKVPVFSDNAGYIVMRRFKAGFLFDLINQIRAGQFIITLKSRLELTCSLVKALKEQIEDNGLIHRDIKVENIVLDINSYELIIIDYGFTIKRDEKDFVRSVGSPLYAAPEVWLNKDEVPLKSDVYSLGMILSILWGDSSALLIEQQDEIPFYHLRERQFIGLFDDIAIDNSTKAEVTGILKGFLNIEPSKRLGLQEALSRLEKLIVLQDTLAPDLKPDSNKELIINENLRVTTNTSAIFNSI
ncbi:MAG: protein kinase [Legionella sp.]|jgi:serine/threonine protein kinase